ncbi:aldehyde reductase [Ophiostoma piceae UAMH 11346]|uniref:Aldehyde reductase n=1 Tax=Ophiostoma piceae (strain UAMH 11346) TaxID=1262450 RepID=S3C321_OPHP1|nr:aldehyde reductase [Ophiostoma piceae UAMH 11346]
MTGIPVCTTKFKLNNGSMGSKDEEALEASIVHAQHSGYRLIDTAEIYQVEPVVGRAIRTGGVPREDITVVTKFWNYWHHDSAHALAISLRDLGLDYIDHLSHAPARSNDAVAIGPRSSTYSKPDAD